MRPFSPTELLATLRSTLPRARSVCVAFSGGVDSTALLYAAAACVGDLRVRAVHVNHGLHPDSPQWAEHCRRVCTALQIDLVTVDVRVERRRELGLEAAAREARYRALEGIVEPGEVLLTAHQADDQLETVLLALMRGAGVRGLAGIVPLQPFGRGWLLRPLLAYTRAQLQAWLLLERTPPLSDPSNDSEALDRNFLRHRVVPLLRERWPACTTSAARAATHLAEAQALLDETAQADLAIAERDACLDVERLRALPPARRRNVLRYWLKSLGARAPSTRKLHSLEHDVLSARSDRIPSVALSGLRVYRYRGLLHGVPERGQTAPPSSQSWNISEPFFLPEGMGSLRMISAVGDGIDAAKLPAQVDVRYRCGGERFRPHGSMHRRTLKNLLQEADVLPWWRDRLPLLFVGERLVAVADLWIAAEFATDSRSAGLKIVWDHRPPLIAHSIGGAQT